MNRIKNLTSNLIGTLLHVIIYTIITSYLIMWLWNTCLVTTVSGLSIITFWKALGLRVLITFLTSSFNHKKDKHDIH